VFVFLLSQELCQEALPEVRELQPLYCRFCSQPLLVEPIEQVQKLPGYVIFLDHRSREENTGKRSKTLCGSVLATPPPSTNHQFSPVVTFALYPVRFFPFSFLPQNRPW